MAINASVFNLITAPVPLIYTAQGPFIICHEAMSAYNTTHFDVAYSDYINTYTLFYRTKWHDAVDAFTHNSHAPCGNFSKISTGRYAWYVDDVSGLTVPPGARRVLRDYVYSHWKDFFLVHTKNAQLVAVVLGNMEVRDTQF